MALPRRHLRLSILAGAAPADPPRGLDIYVLDAMGGAATLVVSPERESILIDSGWPGLDDRDPKRIEHVLKDVAGLDHLDHLVTTHWHADHFGGVEGLAPSSSGSITTGTAASPGVDGPDGDRADYPDGPARLADDPLRRRLSPKASPRDEARRPSNRATRSR